MMSEEQLKELNQSLDQLAKANRALIRSQSFWHSFLRGVITAVGATVGAAIVITLIISLLNQLSGLNTFRPFVDQILPYVDKNYNPSPVLPTPIYRSPELPTPLPTPSPTFSILPQ